MIHRQRARAQQGFGLLEAIVAMVILGSAGLVLFGWIQQSLESATRLRRIEQRAATQLEVQEYLGGINPGLRPSGRDELPGLLLEWSGELVEPMRNEFDYEGNLQPHWRIGLFRLKVKATREGEVTEWTQLQAGWAPLAAVVLDGAKSP